MSDHSRFVWYLGMCCLFDRKYADRGESPGTGQFSAGAGDTMYSDDSKPTVTGVCTVLIKIEDLYLHLFIAAHFSLILHIYFSLCWQLKERLPLLLDCLHSHFTAVRHMAARCFGMLCQVMTLDLMTFIIEKIVPLMDIADNVIYRQGATEALACILSIFSKKRKIIWLV